MDLSLRDGLKHCRRICGLGIGTNTLLGRIRFLGGYR